jgi:hypothetical protein
MEFLIFLLLLTIFIVLVIMMLLDSAHTAQQRRFDARLRIRMTGIMARRAMDKASAECLRSYYEQIGDNP